MTRGVSHQVGLGFAFLLMLGLIGCGAKRAPVHDHAIGDKNRRGVIQTAYSQIGTPYRYGGTSPDKGFDCSGFAQWVYGKHGVTLPRRSVEQRQVGRKVGKGQLKEADLIFFDVSGKGSLHVGIYVGEKGFIHSPSSGGRVRRDNLDQRYWKKCFLEGRQLLP